MQQINDLKIEIKIQIIFLSIIVIFLIPIIIFPQSFASDLSEDAEDEIEDAQEEIDEVQEEIDEEKADGKNTILAEAKLVEAQTKLNDAQTQFDLGNFENAIELAEQADDLAEEAEDLIGKIPPVKVTICHNEKNTITISLNALQAHLDHGDTEGVCVEPEPEKKVNGGGSGDSQHKTRPTMALSWINFKRIIDDAITFNGFVIDADTHNTDFLKQITRIEEPNNISSKVLAEKGLILTEYLFGCKYVGDTVCQGGFYIKFDRHLIVEDIIPIDDMGKSDNVIVRDVSASARKVDCINGLPIQCVLVEAEFTFIKMLDDNTIFAVQNIDSKRRYSFNWFNQGIEVLGIDLSTLTWIAK